MTAGTFRGCLVVKNFAILTRSDGQHVLDLAAAIMWAGQCDMAEMLREVHSYKAYASLVSTVARSAGAQSSASVVDGFSAYRALVAVATLSLSGWNRWWHIG